MHSYAMLLYDMFQGLSTTTEFYVSFRDILAEAYRLIGLLRLSSERAQGDMI